MMICIIVAGSLILVELPTDWTPLRNGYENTVSEGFTPVMGHVTLLYQPRRGTNKLLRSTPREALPPMGDSWYWSFLLSGEESPSGVVFTYHSVFCSLNFSVVC